MEPARTPAWVIWVVPGLAVLAAGLGLTLYRTNRTGLPEPERTMLELVQDRVLRQHVDGQDPHELVLRAIDGMVRGLDPYSDFIRPDEVQRFDRLTTGSYDGIGVLMAPGIVPVTVLYPMPDGPAERAGLQVGDELLAVDGTPLQAESPDALAELAHARLTGPTDTRIVVTIRRGDLRPFDVPLVRSSVQQRSVHWVRFVEPALGVGYLHVASFQRQTVAEFDAALDLLQRERALAALVLDLRWNGGGLLEESVPLVNRFLRDGVIATLIERGQPRHEHRAQPDRCTRPELPLVVLINAESASASEIVAGALQDHRRARIVGERSYGKAAVQSIFRWNDLPMRLKLTTGRYQTPNGRDIEGPRQRDGTQQGGILPDVESRVERDLAQRIQLGLNGQHDLPPAHAAAARALATRLQLPLTTPLGPDQDPQLAAAIGEARRLLGERKER
jgi:carboxyl-terminal processing protease